MYLILNSIFKYLTKVLCLTFVFAILLNTSVFAQTWPTDTIHVQINTNNPAFPFPQFLEYEQGASLAKNNAVGVTHADMEKAMREAYQIMMRRALKVPGKVLNGVQYIQYNTQPTVPQGYNTFVSEGDGYALLAAAYFADKPTFDGLWAWVHDNRLSGVNKYYNCTALRPGYAYGPNFAGWNNNENTLVTDENPNNSAGDGDVDIAMALLIAAKQWPTGGIMDGCTPSTLRTYKSEAIKMISALVDTFYYAKSTTGAQPGSKGYLTGIVGVDGYIKSGNTWGEVTNWRYSAANTTYPWAMAKPDPIQVNSPYVDYNAPAYFEQFATFLAANGGTPWQISQCRRCAGSGDWTIGQMYAKGYIASAGNYTVSDNGATTTFGSFSAGEDFRMAWRTILNYVWHGNPTTTWNPVTHQLTAAGNTFEYDMALRHKEFLKFPNSLPSSSANAFCSKLGASPDPGQPSWKGVAQIKQQYAPNGSVLANYGVNWMAGTGAPAAVASGDIDLTAELYRQCELSWDDQSGLQNLPDYQRYIGSTPKYFHGWFRTLGMLTTSGNLHAPEKMVAAANMKVYMAVDKTFAYEGDLLNYEVSYRNYGSVDATGVNITTTIDPNYQIVSASNGGAISGNSITWSIGTVTGFKTNGLAATKGKRTFVVKVKPIAIATVACLTSTITSTNAPTWTSNEYPNNASYTMERNCVDLLKDRVLAITKTTDRSVMNSGDIVNFTLNFENKTGSNLWLNGGRDGVILSYANFDSGTGFYQFYRIWHTAQEAYINLGNYRVSYFMNDAAAIGKFDAATNPTGWDTYVDNQSDLDKYGYNPLTLPVNEQLKFTYQKIPWGSDANGAWNQRVITQFANVLSAPSTHVFDKLDSKYLIHKGVVGPGFTRTRFESKPSSLLAPRLVDDWSFDIAVKNTDNQGQGQYFFPVTPSYTNFNSAPKFAPVLVNNYSKDACGGPVQNFKKVLFEEFDGYTWRRIAGNGPLPGRETYNVVVTDSIPIELAWSAFTDDNAVGVTATYTPLTANPKFSGYVKWTIPVMLTGEKGDLSYMTIAKSPCAEKTFINAGWIWSDVDSPDSSAVKLKLTCTAVPPTPPIETSLVKTADKTNVVVGDVVTYTLTYTNKDGSTASWNNTSTLASDWQTIGTGTTMPDINKSTFTIDNNNTSVDAGPNGFAFGHKKSHGKNGYSDITFTIKEKGTFSLFFRNTAGTPGKADFKGIRLEIIPTNPNVINFKVYNNNTLLQDLPNIAYPGSVTSIKLRAQLVDDKLYIWMNDFTGAPLKVISGITNLDAGYAGIFSAASAEQVFSSYTTHWDSAFDLFISDPVPTQLNNIVNISDSGVLTGTTVAWPTIPGPILANVVTTRTFKATVNTCTDFITNIGKATVFGVSNIQSQYVVTCGATVPPGCVPPTTVTVTTTTPALCKGAALTVKGTASPANANYFYTWYRNGVAITTASKTYADLSKAITVVADSGTYTLRVEDGNAGSALCYKEKSIKVRIDTVSIAGKISSSQELCLGSAASDLTGTVSTGGVTAKNYQWQKSIISGVGPWSDIGVFSSTTTGFVVGTPTATTYYRRVDSSGMCARVYSNVDTIRVNNTPILSKIDPVLRDTLCVGGNFNLSTTIKLADSTGVHASKNGGYYFTWQHLRAGVVIATDTKGPLPYKNFLVSTRAAVLSDSGLYRLIVQDGKTASKCQDTISIRIVVNQAPTIKASIAKHQELCKGDAANPITEVQAVGNYFGNLYTQWYTTKDTIGVPILTKITTAGTEIDYNPGSPVTTDYYVRKDSVQYCAAVRTNFIKVRVNNSVVVDTILPIENDTLCVSAGSKFQLKGVVDSTGKASINKGYYFTWQHYRNGALISSSVPSLYVDYPATSRLAVEADSGTYYLIVQDGFGATLCQDTLKTKVVVILSCSIVVPTCTKPVFVSTKLVGNDTLCVGNNFTLQKDVVDLSGGAALSGYYYSWRKVNSAGSVVVSAPSLTYTDLVLTNITQADSGRYYLIVQDGLASALACKDSSAAISIVVNAPITVAAVIARSQIICNGTAPGLLAETTPSGIPMLYKWYISSDSFKTAVASQVLVGEITDSYQSPVISSTAYFIRKDSTAGCPAINSNIVTIQVDQAVIPAVVGKDTIVCTGSAVPLFEDITPVSGGTGVFTYQWQSSGDSFTFADIPNATNNTFQSPVLFSNNYFRRMDSSGVCGTLTNTISVVVKAPISAPAVIGSSDTICIGSAPTMFTEITASGVPDQYQWYISTDSFKTVSATQIIVGAITNSYQSTSLTNTSYFLRKDSVGYCPALNSNILTIYIDQPSNPGKIGKDTVVCTGSAIRAFEEIIAASLGTGTFAYQWQSSSDNTTFTDIVLATNASYQSPSIYSKSYFRRQVRSGACANTYTDTITVDVLSGVNAGVVSNSSPTICYNRIPRTAFVNVTGASNGTGGAGSERYQWQKSEDNLSWTDIVSETGLGYVETNALIDTMYYRRRVVMGLGACDTSYTTPIAINVYAPFVVGSIGIDSTVCRGVSIVLHEKTAVSGGGLAGSETYKWFSSVNKGQNWTPASGLSDQKSYTTAILTDSIWYRRVVNTQCNNDTSNVMHVNVNPISDVSVSITDFETCAGTDATFTSIATGEGSLPTYTWYSGASSTGPWVGIPSATANAYTVVSPQEESDGTYYKVILKSSELCNTGDAESSAKLSVKNATVSTVTISTPTNTTCEGYPITITAKATGVAPSYQWYVVPLGSAVGAVGDAVGTNSDSYRSAFENGDRIYVSLGSTTCGTGEVKSDEITINVLPVPNPVIVQTQDTICSGDVFNYTATVGSGSLQWLYNGKPIAGETKPTYNKAIQSGQYAINENNGTCNFTSQPSNLVVLQTPVAYAGSDITLPEGVVGFLNGSGGAIYSWSPGTYLNSTTISNPSFKATQTIPYVLTVTDATGKCKATDEVIVYVVKPIKVPNVITVNGDGVNDDWKIENIEGYPNVIIEIYNRWGNLVWKTAGYPKNWDGTNYRNGEVLPEGTYFYIINLQSQVYPEPNTGWVQIIK